MESLVEAIFFRMIVVCEQDASPRNFLLSSDGRVVSINLVAGSSFTADKQIRLVMHPYFGRVMQRVLTAIGGKTLPSRALRGASRLLQTYSSETAQARLAADIGLEHWQVAAMMTRLTELFETYGGCLPMPEYPAELKAFVGQTSESKLGDHLWSRIKNAFGL
jgi:hypothetical protein